MKKLILLILLIFCMSTPVCATEIVPPDVPDAGEKYMPEDAQTFGEGLWYVIRSAIADLQPSVAQGAATCLSLIAVVILITILHCFPGTTKRVTDIVGTVLVGVLMLQPSNALIKLGTQTITELYEYGKLLLPVMTAALAAQGAVGTSAALYAGTALFTNILTTVISRAIIPMLYIYLLLCIADSAIGEEVLKNLKKFLKWAITWSLKIILYIFTGYIGITGVVSGSADAAAVKATKLAISGFVPVVGGILSDASETVLVSAGVMKSAAGVYGILAMIAVFIGPFLQIGIQYLLLKITASVCNIFGAKSASELIHDFSGAMGMVLGTTGAVCLILLVGTVCFMKGVT